MSQVSNIRPAWNSPLTSACSLGALETLVPGISRSSKSRKLVWDILEFFPLCRSAKAQRQSTKICFSLSRSRQNRVAAWKLQTSQTHVHTCKVPPPFQPSTSCKTTLYHYRTYNKYKQHKLASMQILSLQRQSLKHCVFVSFPFKMLKRHSIHFVARWAVPNAVVIQTVLRQISG